MMSNWIFLSILAAAIWALSNMIDKHVIIEHIKRPIVLAVLSGIIGAIFALFVGVAYGVTIYHIDILFLAALSGSIYLLAIYLYFRALSIESISIVIPMIQTVPIFTLFFAILILHETLGPSQYVGVILMVLGAMMLSLEKEKEKIVFRKSIWLIVGACICFGLSMVFSKYLLGFMSYWDLYFWARIGSFLPVLTLLFIPAIRRRLRLLLKDTNKAGMKLVGISESLNLLGLFIINAALVFGSASLVSSLTATQPLFILLYIGILFLFAKQTLVEETGKRSIAYKVISIVLIIIGTYYVVS